MKAQLFKAQIVLAAFLLTPAFAPNLAHAQQGPPMQGPPMPMRGHDGPGDYKQSGHGHDSMGMLPPGMWWKNPKVAADLGLTPDQQKKMEDIFIQSRTQLIQLHANLEQQQLLLEPLMDANPVDQSKALAQIGKIADARAELEKSNAKMLLSLRSTLTPEQWTKLQAEHHGHGEGPGQGPMPKGGDRSTHQRGPGGPPPAGQQPPPPPDDIQ
jgi:Spy/CpxP family protein refolding chaperone